MPPMKMVICEPSLNRTATIKCPLWRRPDCILGEERGGGGLGVVLVQRLFLLQSQCTNLLGYLWIGRVILLGKAGSGKDGHQSSKGK
jgi:hypothetical protein